MHQATSCCRCSSVVAGQYLHAFFNPETSDLIQKRHPYIGILNSTQKHLATVKTCFYIVEMIYFSTTCENSNT